MDWTEKYRPDSVSDVVGNEESVQKVREWLQDGSEDALIIHGPPGIGKTSTALALARDEGYRVQELNASDDRTGSRLKRRFGSVSRSKSFDAERRLVVLDEGDNLDRGGSRAVNKGIQEATEPIIIIANDLYDGVPKSIRSKSQIVEFEPVDPHAVMTRLEEICEAEGVEYTMDAITEIAENADGDLRAAVGDLQSSVQGKSENAEITVDRVFDELGELPGGSVFVGEQDVDQTRVWKVLTEWFGADQEERWVIPLAPGFSLVTAEYALSNDFEYSVELPCHYPEVMDEMSWDDEYEERMEKVIQGADSVSVTYEPSHMDEFDLDEFFKWVFVGAQGVYGWVDGKSTPWVSHGWAYQSRIDRINLAKV